MTCPHTKADTHTSRLAMLISAKGVGFYECHARLSLPLRVPIQVGVLFLAPMLLLFLEVPAFPVGLIVGGMTIVILRILLAATLEVTPMQSAGDTRNMDRPPA